MDPEDVVLNIQIQGQDVGASAVFQEIAAEAQKTTDQIVKSSTEMRGAYSSIAASQQELGISSDQTDLSLVRLGTTTAELGKQVGPLAKSFDTLAGGSERLLPALKAVVEQSDLAVPSLTRLAPPAAEASTAFSSLASRSLTLSRNLDRVVVSGDAAALSLRGLIDVATPAADGVVAVSDAARIAAPGLRSTATSGSAASRTFTAIANSGQRAALGTLQANRQLQDIIPTLDAVGLAGGEAAGGVSATNAAIRRTGVDAQGSLGHLRNLEYGLRDLHRAASRASTTGFHIGVGTALATGGALYEAGSFGSQIQAMSGNLNDTRQQTAAMTAEVRKLLAAGPENEQSILHGYLHAQSTLSGVPGYTPAAIRKVIEDAWQSAVGSHGSEDAITNALATALRNWRIGPNQALQATDVLHSIGARGNVTLEDLTKNMSRSGLQAATLGISLPSWGALFDTLTKSFGSPARTDTYLSGLFSKILQPTPGGRKEIAALGLTGEWSQAGVEKNGIFQVLTDLIDRAKKESSATGQPYSQIIGQLLPTYRGGYALQALQTRLPEAETLNRYLGGSATGGGPAVGTDAGPTAGITSSKFKEMMDTLAAQFKQIRNEMKLVAVDVGTVLTPAFLSAAKSFEPILHDFDVFASQHPHLIQQAVEIGLAIGGIGLAGKGILAVLGPIASLYFGLKRLGEAEGFIGGLKKVFAAMTSPVALVAVGVLALGAAFVYAYTHNEDFRRSVDHFATVTLPILQAAFSGFLAMLKAEGTIAGRAIEAVAGPLAGLLNLLSGGRESTGPSTAFQNLAAVLGAMLPVVLTLTLAWKTLSGIWTAGSTVVTGITALMESQTVVVIGNTAAWIASRTAALAMTIAAEGLRVAMWALQAAMEANPIGLMVIALAAVAAGLIYAYNNIKPVHDAIDGLGKGFMNFLGVLGQVAGWIKDHWQTVLIVALAGPFAPAILIARAFGPTILGFLKTLLTDIKTWGGNVFSAIGTFFDNSITSASKWGPDFEGAVMAFLNQLVDDVKRWAPKILNALKKPFDDLYDHLVGHSLIPDLIDEMVTMFGGAPTQMALAFTDHSDAIHNAILSAVQSATHDASDWLSHHNPLDALAPTSAYAAPPPATSPAPGNKLPSTIWNQILTGKPRKPDSAWNQILTNGTTLDAASSMPGHFTSPVLGTTLANSLGLDWSYNANLGRVPAKKTTGRDTTPTPWEPNSPAAVVNSYLAKPASTAYPLPVRVTNAPDLVNPQTYVRQIDAAALGQRQPPSLTVLAQQGLAHPGATDYSGRQGLLTALPTIAAGTTPSPFTSATGAAYATTLQTASVRQPYGSFGAALTGYRTEGSATIPGFAADLGRLPASIAGPLKTELQGFASTWKAIGDTFNSKYGTENSRHQAALVKIATTSDTQATAHERQYQNTQDRYARQIAATEAGQVRAVQTANEIDLRARTAAENSRNRERTAENQRYAATQKAENDRHAANLKKNNVDQGAELARHQKVMGDLGVRHEQNLNGIETRHATSIAAAHTAHVTALSKINDSQVKSLVAGQQQSTRDNKAWLDQHRIDLQNALAGERSAHASHIEGLKAWATKHVNDLDASLRKFATEIRLALRPDNLFASRQQDKQAAYAQQFGTLEYDNRYGVPKGGPSEAETLAKITRIQHQLDLFALATAKTDEQVGRATGDLNLFNQGVSSLDDMLNKSALRQLFARGGLNTAAVGGIAAGQIQSERGAVAQATVSGAVDLITGKLSDFSSQMGTILDFFKSQTTAGVLSGNQTQVSTGLAGEQAIQSVLDKTAAITAAVNAQFDLADGNLSAFNSDLDQVGSYLTGQFFAQLEAGKGVNQDYITGLDTIRRAQADEKLSTDGLTSVLAATSGTLAEMDTAAKTLSSDVESKWERAVLDGAGIQNTYSGEVQAGARAQRDLTHAQSLEAVIVGQMTGDFPRLKNGLDGLFSETLSDLSLYTAELGRQDTFGTFDTNVSAMADRSLAAADNLSSLSDITAGVVSTMGQLDEAAKTEFARTGQISGQTITAYGTAYHQSIGDQADAIAAQEIIDRSTHNMVGYLKDLGEELSLLHDQLINEASLPGGQSSAQYQADLAKYKQVQYEQGGLQSIVDAGGDLSKIGVSPGDSGLGLDRLKNSADSAATAVSSAQDTINGLNLTIQRDVEAQNTARDKYGLASQQYTDATTKLGNDQGKLTDAQAKLTDAQNQASTAQTTYTNAVSKSGDAQAQAQWALDQFNSQGLTPGLDALKQYTIQIDVTKSNVKDFGATAAEAQSGVGNLGIMAATTVTNLSKVNDGLLAFAKTLSSGITAQVMSVVAQVVNVAGGGVSGQKPPPGTATVPSNLITPQGAGAFKTPVLTFGEIARTFGTTAGSILIDAGKTGALEAGPILAGAISTSASNGAGVMGLAVRTGASDGGYAAGTAIFNAFINGGAVAGQAVLSAAYNARGVIGSTLGTGTLPPGTRQVAGPTSGGTSTVADQQSAWAQGSSDGQAGRPQNPPADPNLANAYNNGYGNGWATYSLTHPGAGQGSPIVTPPVTPPGSGLGGPPPAPWASPYGGIGDIGGTGPTGEGSYVTQPLPASQAGQDQTNALLTENRDLLVQQLQAQRRSDAAIIAALREQVQDYQTSLQQQRVANVQGKGAILSSGFEVTSALMPQGGMGQ